MAYIHCIFNRGCLYDCLVDETIVVEQGVSGKSRIEQILPQNSKVVYNLCFSVSLNLYNSQLGNKHE